jgi:predicted nucleic acid-binding protein
VKAFFDTSVLIAAVRASDLRHEVSRQLWAQANPQDASCSAHTLAEVYASLTGMRPPNRFRPDQAVLVLNQVRTKLVCITLTVEEVLDVTHRTAALKLPGGIIYDALLMGCARKVKAECIYTWNEKHFRMVAPDLADRIMTP